MIQMKMTHKNIAATVQDAYQSSSQTHKRKRKCKFFQIMFDGHRAVKTFYYFRVRTCLNGASLIWKLDSFAGVCLFTILPTHCALL